MSAYNGPRYVFSILGGPVEAVHAIEVLVPGARVFGYMDRRRYALSRLEPVAWPRVHAWEVVVPLHGAWLVDGHLQAAGVAFRSLPIDVAPWLTQVGSRTVEDRETLLATGRAWIERMVAMGEVHADQAARFTPYQVRGVAWSATRPWTLDIWTTGSGKTLEGTLAGLTRDGPILVLGPAVVRRAWRQDVPQFSQLELHRVLPKSERGVRYEDLSTYLARMRNEGKRPIVVAGMEALGDYVEELAEVQPATLIFDELQAFASPERWTRVSRQDGTFSYEEKRTKEGEIQRNVHAARVTAWGSIQQRIGLSAQPLDDGRPWRYWALLDLLDPGGWGSRRPFEIRYADGHEEKGRWVKTGKSNLSELKQRASFMVHEVLPSEVAKYMPPLRVDVVYLEPQDQCEPDAFVEEIRKLERATGADDDETEAYGNVVEAKLAQAASRKRRYVFYNTLETISGGGKVVIFVERKPLAMRWAGLLEAQAKKVRPETTVWLATGDASDAERDRILDAYKAHPGPCLLVATGQSMGMSKDGMQHTDLAIQAQLPRRPGDLVQRRGRFSRLGGRACRYVIPIAQYTYDEVIVQGLGGKIRTVRELTTGEELAGLDRKLMGVDDLARVRREVLASLGIEVPPGL